MVIDIGYKQTEIGIIPEDWTLAKLSEYLKSKPKYGIGAAAVPYDDNKLTYLRITDISDDGHFINKNKASINSLYASEYILLEHDIVVARTGASVGKSYLYNTKDGVLVYAGFLIRLNPNIQVLNSTFLKYILQTNYYWNWVRENSMRSGQPGINSQQLQTLTFAIPNIKEQTAIANALSDMDALIAQTEKIIEKKKAIKQGVMQELLRPKEGWVEKELGKIGEINGSGVDKKIIEDEIPVRLVNYMDVYRRDFIYSFELSHWVTAPAQKKDSCMVKQGDIFFTPSSETRTDIALAAVAMDNIDDAVYSYHVVRFRILEDWDFKFRAYIFNTRKFLEQAESLCEGGGKRYVLTLPKFKALKVRYPPSKIEQARISQILWDIDRIIWNYERKLKKLKLQKQGMMQALLTGKIRLV